MLLAHGIRSPSNSARSIRPSFSRLNKSASVCQSKDGKLSFAPYSPAKDDHLLTQNMLESELAMEDKTLGLTNE